MQIFLLHMKTIHISKPFLNDTVVAHEHLLNR